MPTSIQASDKKVIDETATFEKFGYYSTDLKVHSHKLIIVRCDKCNTSRERPKYCYTSLCGSCARKGLKRTEETKKKISVSKSGNKHPMYGKLHSEASKQKMRLVNRGEKHHGFGKPCSIAIRQKISDTWKGKAITAEITESRKNLVHHKGSKHHNWQGGISFKPYCKYS